MPTIWPMLTCKYGQWVGFSIYLIGWQIWLCGFGFSFLQAASHHLAAEIMHLCFSELQWPYVWINTCLSFSFVVQIVEKLLIAAVADADVTVRRSVFLCMHGNGSFDEYLAQADSLTAIFVALNDEVCYHLLPNTAGKWTFLYN